MKEKCGIFGIHCEKTNSKCIPSVINGLRYLQHRGHEGCGISYLNNSKHLVLKKGLGRVDDVFKRENILEFENSNKCIGHVRYSTSGNSKLDDKQKYTECQPLLGNCKLGTFYLVHNGNIPNIKEHDTQFIISFIENNDKESWREIFISLIETIPCAYCLLIITQDEIFAVRDRFGIRPLCIGIHECDYCITSESCALQHFELLRDVKPGEIIRICSDGLETLYQSSNSQLRICAFEFIYFQQPNSICEQLSVSQVRTELGKLLAHKEKLCDFDDSFVVVGVPSTGIISAKGYAEQLHLSYKQIINKNNNIGRTFIAPSHTERQTLCEKKFIIDETELLNKKVIIVDDTIVRGNVIKSIVSKVWQCGALEIHVRIPAPPIINICRLGIDIPSHEELLAYNKTIPQIETSIDVTSIMYLSCDDLNSVLPSGCYKECFGEKIEEAMLFSHA
jgi:amidophosphoribosyltransferase